MKFRRAERSYTAEKWYFFIEDVSNSIGFITIHYEMQGYHAGKKDKLTSVLIVFTDPTYHTSEYLEKVDELIEAAEDLWSFTDCFIEIYAGENSREMECINE